ncbi:MAG: L,D-transpeptidase [Polyangiaceae bacterium]|nr:L,D-transpeptidase [Polyangiaceae bacterium]
MRRLARAASWCLLASCAPQTSGAPASGEPVVSASAAPAPPPSESAPSSASSVADPAPAPPAPFWRERLQAPAGTRVYAKTRYVWVHYEPSAASGWRGFLWLGGYADVARGPIVGQGGCAAWYEVKPRGYVCVDGDKATLDPADPQLLALLPYAPDVSSPWPHRYGESRGAQRYRELPTPEQQRGREWDLPEHRARMQRAAEGDVHASLVGVDLSPGSTTPLSLPALPATLREERKRLLPQSTVAWSREWSDGERSWLLSGDFVWVPKDRVAPYPVSRFHGVTLGGEVRLPLAFFKQKARPRYKVVGDAFEPDGAPFERHAWVMLTGEARAAGGKRYLETREPGVWVQEADATVARAREVSPWGAKIGEPDATGKAPRGRQTWLDASILSGWMVAYEGTTPVYATLISPGRGGLPERGKDPIETASTPAGAYAITGKFATATMVAPGEFIHSDVPYAQNFHGPHAIHVAYWHDDWGDKKSAGCVNVSAIDGKWLFDWTEPRIPPGWHGVRLEPDKDPATLFYLHE